MMNSGVVVFMYLCSLPTTNGIQHIFDFTGSAAREQEAPDPALHSDVGCSLPNKLYQIGGG